MNKILSKSKTIVRKYAPLALSCLATAGVVATAILSAKATPAAVELINAAKKDKPVDENSRREVFLTSIKAAWKCYLPTAAVGTATIACIVGSNVLSSRQQVALMGAYAAVQKTYSNYKNKLKELYGEETHEAIMEAIVKEKCEDVDISAVGSFYSSSLDFGKETEPDVIRTFYDPVSERYFETTTAKVIEAEYHLNRNFMLGGSVTVNNFYEFLGLKEIDDGDRLGWSCVNGDIYWIDFTHYVTTLDDGMQVHVIEPVFDPVTDFDDN